MIPELAHVWSRPLLLDEDHLETFLANLRTALEERPTAEQKQHGYTIDHGVATVPIRGTLISRNHSAGLIGALLGIQSYEHLGKILENAHRDQRVRGILLDIDSPGGMADGAFDLADKVHALAKPVWAIAQHSSLSAAYTLAAAADRVWATQTAQLGSLGVVAVHADRSEADAQEGVKYTFITRGARKLDANPHTPLGPEAHIRLQREVDRIHEKLISQTARHRNLDPAMLQSTEAAIYSGEDAISRGLADRIGTFDEAHAALIQHVTPKGGRIMDDTTALPPPSAAEAPPDNVVQLNAISEAVAAERARAVEVDQLCALAGFPELAAEQNRLGTHPDALRQLLQIKKVAEAAATPLVAIDTSQTAQRKPSISSKIAEAAEARFRAQSQGR